MVESAFAGAAGFATDNWDVPSFFTGLSTEIRANRVSQEFQRRLAEINYKITRQTLHREDIRDLVELTVGRMDIYHVVGTLLLAFCIGWFTDNRLLDSNLPPWFIMLFLISNFTAVGYLVFSVWLAMHASIASHSLGVRLLTSFARLSVPTRKQLEEIKISIMPFIDRFIDLGKRITRPLPSGKGKDTDTKEQIRGNRIRRDPTQSSDTSADEDDRRHFRRFVKEQNRWLAYDAYARLCMSFGMNQMIQSLSYYILGVVYKEVPLAALTAFIATKGLGFLLLRLDGDDFFEPSDQWAFLLFYLTPPALAAGLLWAPVDDDVDGHPDRISYWVMSFLVAPCFILHAGWLFYIAYEVLYDHHLHSDPTRLLPSRLRLVHYLSVLDAEQQEAALAIRNAEVRAEIDQLQAAQEELRRNVKGVMEEERAEKIAIARATDDELQNARENLESQIAKARVSLQQDPLLQAEIKRAETLVDYIAVWEKAPEILASLQALRDRGVQGFIKDEEKTHVEHVYQTFLDRCRELDLGIVINEQALRVNPDNKNVVRLDACDDKGFPHSVWVDTRTGEMKRNAPVTSAPVTSLSSALDIVWPEWDSNARKAKQEDEYVGQANNHERAPLLANVAPPDVLADCSDMALAPEASTPSDVLPGKVVRYFTVGTAVWWVVAAFVNIGRGFFHAQPLKLLGREYRHAVHPLEVRRLNAIWPAPRAFFEVSALQCHDSSILVTSEFSTFYGKLSSDRLSDLRECGEFSAATVFCGRLGCDVLRQASSVNGSWTLASLDAPLGSNRTSAPVDIPSTWRNVAASWASCSSLETCDTIRLAGWDGKSIVVASLQRDFESDVWKVRLRFRIDNNRQHCTEAASITGNEKSDPIYDQGVHAMQFGKGGHTLAVLLPGGLLDGWDLFAGEHLGRWRVDAEHSAMCHDGNRMLLARMGPEGPVLEDVPLPVELADARLDSDEPAKAEV